MKHTLTSLLVLLCSVCFAQFQKFSDDLLFQRFSTDEGLSQATVNAILRDSKGFIWFGTEDGLNRYDGHQFRIYRKKADDTTSVSGSAIRSLWEDKKSRLFVGTMEGLSIYDRHLETFKQIGLDESTVYPCHALLPDNSTQRVFIAAGIHGLLSLDLTTLKLSRIDDPRISQLNVISLARVKEELYIGTLDRGLFRIDLNTNVVERVEFQKGLGRYAPVRALTVENDSLLWIGTEGNGAFIYSTQTGSVVHQINKANRSINDDRVWSVEVDPNYVWIGTDGGGLNRIDRNAKKSSFHQHSYYNTQSIGSNHIRCIARDPTGDMWFGTFNGGTSYLPSFAIRFHTFRKDPEEANALPHNSILSFCELEDGRLLIGTDGGGLVVLKDGKFSSYQFPPHVIPPSVILSIKQARNGDIYLGTYQEGLYRLNKDRSVTRYIHDTLRPSSISSNTIWDIEQDDDGSIWFATESGINRLNQWSNDFTNYNHLTAEDDPQLFTSAFTQTILLDSAKTLWIGYYGMLQSYYVPTGRLTSYKAADNGSSDIPNKQILSLNLDQRSRNDIWFSAFGEGIIRFNTITKKFTRFTMAEGLPNNLVFSVQTDRKGKVWLTCNKGLVRFDPSEKSFYVFDKEYGINVAPFKENAAAISSSGHLMFGGMNGFTAFWPGDLNFQKQNLEVVFTGLRLFNQDVPIDNSILHRSITETTSLEIPYDKAKLMSLEFSVPNFLAPSAVQYQYMLEGFEDNWHILENENISFTNLLPGKYQLRVKAGFPSAIWGHERVLSINVIPPWYLTWYARVGLLMLVVGVTFGFYQYRTYSLNRRKAELEKIVTIQNQEIWEKNRELAEQNEKLSSHNKELLENRETISKQNRMLFDAQEQLQEINQSLEKVVQQRTERLNETITQLNKTIRELDAFLYSASHDLISPLKSILGLVNLGKKENTDPNIGYYFDHIERSVKKLEEIIHTLMQHSFNTKADVRLEQVDLKTIIDETLLEVQYLGDANKIQFQCHFREVPILTDVHRFKIILTNLFSNAVKYHDPEKGLNAVSIKYTNMGDEWVLEVMDNGIGIEQSRLSRVFELFYRATETAKGSGLGLYIVKDTVERLGGRITVESELGKWTRFLICMPVHPKRMQSHLAVTEKNVNDLEKTDQ